MDEFDQIENEYLERVEARRAPSQPYPLVSPQPPQMPAIPLYDISLAQAPEQQAQQAQQEPLLTRKVAGLPVWGWGLLSVAGLGLSIYAWKQSGKVESNPEPKSERPERAALLASTGDWSPSRSRFGESLERWAKGRSIPASQITVYTDADEAKRHVKPVSPLVTLRCSAKVPMDELQKLCAEEGLCATDHGGGVIGFYPAESGSRAQEWESYIDALRDEGQTV